MDLFLGNTYSRAQGSSRPDSDKRGNAQDMIDAGTWFVGTPAQVTEQIIYQYRVTGGFGTLLQLGYDYSSDTDREMWFKSMELHATQVLPEVNRQLALEHATGVG